MNTDNISLANILEALTGTYIKDAESIHITGAAKHSQEIMPGGLFVAIKGEAADGHDYVDQAFKNGAKLALIEKRINTSYPIINTLEKIPANTKFQSPLCLLVEDSLAALQKIAAYWQDKLKVRTIGITGSVGKSTSKEVISDILSVKYNTLKNLGNLNNEIGLPLTILGLSKAHQRMILEMGFYVPGEIKFLCDIAQPKVGVITNIGHVHAERAGSQESIARGKAELVEALPEDGYAILNYDDPLVRDMADKTKANVLFYGLSKEADLYADEIDGLGLDGIRLRLNFRGDSNHLRVPLIGRHSVHTVLRASAVGLVEGLDWPEIIYGLKTLTSQLRLMAVRAQNGAILIDDTYNASPQSTLAALELLSELPGKKIAVLGDMLELGQYETQGHERVGIKAAEIADTLIVLGERAETIAKTAELNGMPPEKIFRIETPGKIAEFLKDHLTKDHSVLVKGSRGMNMDGIVPALEKVS
jgi:UDP-N-acetylmuramoyl-tripeptide--D-alanyl-D-alanine ligase